MEKLDELIKDMQNTIDRTSETLPSLQNSHFREVAQTTIDTHTAWVQKLKKIRQNLEVAA